MFESIQREGVPESLRNAAVAPMAAFLFAQLYFTLYPLLDRVPPAFFWSIDTVVLLGAIAGAFLIFRIVLGAKIRGRAMGWLIVAGCAELACAWLFLSLTFPWL